MWECFRVACTAPVRRASARDAWRGVSGSLETPQWRLEDSRGTSRDLRGTLGAETSSAETSGAETCLRSPRRGHVGKASSGALLQARFRSRRRSRRTLPRRGVKGCWEWRLADLNRGHPHFQCGALPTELSRLRRRSVEPGSGMSSGASPATAATPPTVRVIPDGGTDVGGRESPPRRLRMARVLRSPPRPDARRAEPPGRHATPRRAPEQGGPSS